MAYNDKKGTCYIVKNKNICFIPISKNGSTTFRKECENNSIKYEIQNFIETPSTLKDNHVVCVLREPVERFCSAYLEILIRTHDCPKTLEKDFFYIQQEPKRFLEFIREIKNEFYDTHVEPQTYFITDYENKMIKIDDFWLLKDLKQKMCATFQIKNIRKYNKKSVNNKQIYMDFLNSNPKVKRVIEQLYSEDIILYNQISKGEKNE